MKKRERTWQDEVKDRVRSRRQRRSGGADLPLFTEDEPATPPSVEPARDENGPAGDVREAEPPVVEARRRGPEDEPRVERDDEPPVAEARLFSPAEGELQDLPLRVPDPPDTAEPERLSPPAPPAEVLSSLDDDLALEETAPGADDDWELPSKPKEPRPVERPALPQERLQAAAVDMALLVTVWTVVVYFASRAAHVSLAALRPSWPWLLAYLAFLGLVYASYFTGTTGQTLGKMVTGLRVLQASNRPPGYLRAFVRAGVGAVGILAAGLGQLPMLFDPARRALHDRLFGTRVVKH
jgi:uncharacterized RDD family membrane protein YckC